MIPAKLIVEPEHMVISVPAVAVALAVTDIGSEKVCVQNPPLLKLKSIEKFPLLGNVTVYGPWPEPLTIAPVGHVQIKLEVGQADPVNVTVIDEFWQIVDDETVKTAIGLGRTVNGIIVAEPTQPLNVGITE